MTKIFFFISLLYCCLIHGQQYSIGVIVSPTFYSIKPLKKTTSSTYESNRGLTVGFDAHYYFSNSKLSVGLLLNTLAFDRTFTPVTNNNVLDPSIPLYTSFKNTYLKIPIYYSISIISSNKISASGSIGIATNILMTSNEQTIYQDLSERPSKFSNSLLLSGLVGINLNYLLADNFLLKTNLVYERYFNGYDPFMAFPTEFRPYIGFEYLF